MLAIHIIGSGSKGNCAIIENRDNGHGILLDCGICKRDVFARAKEAGFDLGKLDCLLITHDHTDHTKGLGVVLRGLKREGFMHDRFMHDEAALEIFTQDISTHSSSMRDESTRGVSTRDSSIQDGSTQDGFPLYSLPEVAKASTHICEVAEMVDLRNLEIGTAITEADIEITPIATSHDAEASCGFLFRTEDGDAIGYATDTGHATKDMLEAFENIRILAIESNHDEHMLKTGHYPYYLQQRILADTGHLSNAQAAEFLKELLGGNNGRDRDRSLEHVIAMHLSENNNLPSLAREALETAVSEAGASTMVHIASQRMLVSIA